MSAAWPMYRAMVGVGLLCGVLIVTVFQVTQPVIARNQEQALQAAVFDVLPGAVTSRPFAYSGGAFARVAPGEPIAASVYAGFDAAGNFVGVAVEAAGMGYQDTISLLYGYSPATQTIVGLRVLASKETPGLGDKIEKDSGFQENFSGLQVAVGPRGDALANPIIAVKHGQKSQPWQIDGITGATVSSTAVAGILNASANVWAPRIAARAGDFQEQR